MCSLNVIEVETHFLMYCPCYGIMRKNLYTEIDTAMHIYLGSLPDNEKLSTLLYMGSNAKLISSYLIKIFEYRKVVMRATRETLH